MKRSRLRVMGLGLVAMLLMAQMAIAAYACPALLSEASGQIAPLVERGRLADAVMPMAQSSPCDEMVGATDLSSANLCAEHCKYGQQTDKAPTVNVPAAVLNALYASPLVRDLVPPPRSAGAATESALVAASPPHTVLHCVYLI